MSDVKKMWVIDFDGGGSATKSAYYAQNENIKCWEAWVYMKGSRSAYDYPATHDRVMRIMQFALDKSDELWGVLTSGTTWRPTVCASPTSDLARMESKRRTIVASVTTPVCRISGIGP